MFLVAADNQNNARATTWSTDITNTTQQLKVTRSVYSYQLNDLEYAAYTLHERRAPSLRWSSSSRRLRRVLYHGCTLHTNHSGFTVNQHKLLTREYSPWSVCIRRGLSCLIRGCRPQIATVNKESFRKSRLCSGCRNLDLDKDPGRYQNSP